MCVCVWVVKTYVESPAELVSQQARGLLQSAMHGRRAVTRRTGRLVPEQLPEVDVLATERDDRREVVGVERRPDDHVGHRLHTTTTHAPTQGRLNQWAHRAPAQGPRILFIFLRGPNWLR